MPKKVKAPNHGGPTYKDTLLAADPNLKRWYNNTKHGSIITAEVGLRRIGRACKLYKTTSQKLAKMSVKEATDFLMDLVTDLHDQGKQPKYMENFVKVLKSWFSYNGIKIEEKIKIPENGKKPSKVQLEQSPTSDQVRKVLNAADLKQKVESTAVGFSGLRIETVGDYEGKDGLKVKDLPEMTVDNESKVVEFAKVPTQVIVRSSLSKAGHQYFTFMPDEECEYVKGLLELRMKEGETIGPESPIDTPLRLHKDALRKEDISHITTRNVGSSIKTAIEEAGFDWRPYILRTYFDTRMMLAEADGLIIRDWRVFFMGHRGDIEHTYTLNKGKLPEDVIEKMRTAFARAAERYLVTSTRRDVTIDTVKEQFNRQFLEMGGFSKEEIDGMQNLAELTTVEIKEMIQNKQKEQMGLNGNNQKIVPMADVERLINEGWEYVRDMPGDKAIVRLPK